MPEKTQMIIANRLRDGFTVFLADGDRWVEGIEAGRLATSDAEAGVLLAAAQAAARRNEVVAPYLIDVTAGPAGRRPLAWREAIRAFGPTVETRAGA
jgi:hypothetical protein